MENGRLIAAGRSAGIYPHSEGRVIRRYPAARSDALDEAALMQHLKSNGYPVPEIFEATSTEIVMEQVDGPTMLEAMARNPASLFRHAALLARLHHRLHEIPAPDWPMRRFGVGDSIVHLDLHPANVLITKSGPVVIDWEGAAVGPPAVDPAVAWILLSCGTPPGGLFTRAFVAAGRRLFVERFIDHFDKDYLRSALDLAAARMRGDGNLTSAEHARIEEFLLKAGSH